MDLKEIKQLIDMLEASSIKKLKLKMADVELTLDKAADQQTVHEPLVNKTPPEKVEEQPVNTHHISVLAPLVGTFYQASSPESAPFVTIGSQVKKGDTLCLIEAMKVLNEIKATADGKIVAIHVSDGDVVAYDQILMEIGE